MADMQLSLSADEREILVNVVENALKEAQIEEHRTKTLSYRESIVARETVLKSLLQKLGRV